MHMSYVVVVRVYVCELFLYNGLKSKSIFVQLLEMHLSHVAYCPIQPRYTAYCYATDMTIVSHLHSRENYDD